MDNTWLFDDEVDNEEPESDEEETQRELESRLYGIVHHNDLSQPLPPSLAKHYSVVGGDDGELQVTLKHSLDDIMLEEVNSSSNASKTENTLENIDCNQINPAMNDDTSAAVELPQSELQRVPDEIERESRFPPKRPRYSDINLDSGTTENIVDSPPQNINFFNFGPGLLKGKKNQQFSKLIVPTSFDPLDWKDDANSSFISIEDCKSQEIILEKMTQALAKCNPRVKIARLARFALLLYRRNIKVFKKKTNKQLKNNNSPSNQNFSLNDSSIDLTQELGLLRSNLDNDIEQCKSRISKKLKQKMNGSITLNISPFKPEPQVVDLVSDDDGIQIEENASYSTSTPKLEFKRNTLQLPLKWTREMAKFYTKPNKSKRSMNVDTIINKLKNSTKPSDWEVDPRDKMGFYHRSASEKKRRKLKCANCQERGHTLHTCPRPRKCCILCGQADHLSFSCPYKICSKCGLFIPPNYEGDECRECYFINLNYDTLCEICGAVYHKTANCTDLWRSFHATTEGEKKIPTEVAKNRRRFCCNCGKDKHFPEDCPFPHSSGHQTNSFVSNYSCDIEEIGTADITFSHNYADILTCPEADMFLQDLSNNTNANILCNENRQGLVFQIKGTFEQCKRVKNELETFVNVHKRKWRGPMPSRKRQRVM